MASIIALLSCREAHEGPWIRSQGHETGVRVYPELGSGEEVRIEQEIDEGSTLITLVTSGRTPLDLATCYRYRAVKVGRGTPTTVEILLNGKP